VWLLRRDTRYRGTQLLREVKRARLYMTMDMWQSREAYEEFREKYANEYAEIDRNWERLVNRSKEPSERAQSRSKAPQIKNGSLEQAGEAGGGEVGHQEFLSGTG
jgi:hypothetical protein